MDAIRDRGESPIGKAEDGFILRFTNADIRKLQDTLGKNFLAEAPKRFQEWDFEWMDAIVAAGVKMDGANVPGMSMMHAAVSDIPLSSVCLVLLDGLYLSYHGQTFREHVEIVRKLIAEAEENGENPLLTPTMTALQSFVGGDSPEESIPTSSGDSAPAKSGNTRRPARKRRSGTSG